MKKVILSLVPLAIAIIALLILWSTFEIPHQEYYNGGKHFPFAKGNAPEELRNDISNQLELFARGYLERDVRKLDTFCSKLISKENILILGTMPQEVFSGYDEARDLVESDWLYWGDVHFFMEETNISVYDSVVWVSTIGQVEFDMSRLLILPLRFTGILVNENSNWKFQQMQFQFDLNNMQILIAIIFMLLISLGSLLRFVILLTRHLRKSK